MLMQLSQVTAFITIAELESFSLAAERLHITQPAVSKRIRQLEQSMKTSLFDRIGKRSILTPNGLAFLPHAERILHEVKTYRSSLVGQNDKPSGSLTLATSHHIGLHRLPQILRDFKIKYPQVDLDLHFMDSEDACAAVANSEIELAIVTLPENADAKLNLETIWIDTLQIVLAPDHPLANDDHIDQLKLLDYPAILPSMGTFTRRIINNYFSTNKDHIKIILETNYLETIKVMVSANLGWSMLPASMLDKTVIGKPLNSSGMHGFEIQRVLGIVTRQNRTLSLSSQAFILMLQQARSESSLNVT
ncbi:MAG: DNA-binding transcriptional LysR family regulator [Candidatus Azotimanducaceae bacterium]|jgi:DNA-binding transcriptional LysR family regulator